MLCFESLQGLEDVKYVYRIGRNGAILEKSSLYRGLELEKVIPS